MISKVVVNNQLFPLEKEDVLGEGGEAVVFKFGPLALKIYRNATKQRERKLSDFFRAGFTLPSNVCAPIELAHDHKGSVVGFTMNRLKAGCDPIAALKNKTYCANNGITTRIVVEIFKDIHSSLDKIHRAGLVIGDLNDRNEMLDSAHLKAAWLDVDSWQFGPYPCMVATEDYLSPDLYGIDLSQKPYFREEHDWFSFAVLLFRSLLRIHPFKAGIHPTYKSLMTRAQRGITVLDSDVRYPNIGLSPDVLSDDFISLLLDYLKRKRKDSFPLDALLQCGEILIGCPSCGLWYAGTRSFCPACQTKSIVDMRLKQVLAGCECEALITTSGKIVFFKIEGNTIYCLVDEGGTTFLYKKSEGNKVLRKEMFRNRTGVKFGLFRENLIVCLDPASESPELLVLDISADTPKPILKTTTRPIAGAKAVFSCSDKYLYRIVGTRVMRGYIFEDSGQLLEREVVQVLKNQTWFAVSPNPSGPELLIGFHRVFGELKWFLVRSETETSFRRFDVDLPELQKGESLIDLSVKFSSSSVLVLRKTRKGGIDYVRIEVVNEDGKIGHSRVVKVSEARSYEDIHGKAFENGIVMHPTEQGIIRESITDQKIEVLKDSDQFVGSSEALHVFGNGLLAVTEDRVLFIVLK